MELESEVIDIKSSSKERIEKLERRVAKLEEENKVLKELDNVHSKADTGAPVVDTEKSFKQERIISEIDEDVVINLEEAQAKLYKIDLEHPKKVLSMQDVNEEEPAKVEEVRRRGVIIQDHKETTSTVVMHSQDYSKDKGKCILIGEPKPLKGKAQIEQDEAFARQLEAELNEVTKKQKMDEEAGDLKSHLQIVANDDDDVYTEATPLASKIPVVDYKIHFERNKPYFKIIRANGNHMLFLSVSTMLKNFDREDLESLWKLVKERFGKTEPKNYSDDYLLKTLRIMFEQPDVEASLWRDQKGRYGFAKRYPLTHFTLEKILNNVRLEVEEVSEMSLELLRTLSSSESLSDEEREKQGVIYLFVIRFKVIHIGLIRPRVSVKGQILADFIVERPKDGSLATPMEAEQELPDPWTLFTDGSFDAANNEAEYEALIVDLRIAAQIPKHNLDLLEEKREQAAIREARSKANMEKYYNSKVRNTSFKPGALVYPSNDASHVEDKVKIGPKWEGPYEVTGMK
nr:reverse transcriptase domain-containing protein [Tanacetum cinerariifolium]